MAARSQLTLFKSPERTVALRVAETIRAAGLDAYVVPCDRCDLYHVEVARVIDPCPSCGRKKTEP